MLPVELIIPHEVSARTYNYWFSLPLDDFLRRTRDEFWSVANDGLLFNADISGYIGYQLYRHFRGELTLAALGTSTEHMVSDYISQTECFFDILIPAPLQTGVITRLFTVP